MHPPRWFACGFSAGLGVPGRFAGPSNSCLHKYDREIHTPNSGLGSGKRQTPPCHPIAVFDLHDAASLFSSEGAGGIPIHAISANCRWLAIGNLAGKQNTDANNAIDLWDCTTGKLAQRIDCGARLTHMLFLRTAIGLPCSLTRSRQFAFMKQLTARRSITSACLTDGRKRSPLRPWRQKALGCRVRLPRPRPPFMGSRDRFGDSRFHDARRWPSSIWHFPQRATPWRWLWPIAWCVVGNRSRASFTPLWTFGGIRSVCSNSKREMNYLSVPRDAMCRGGMHTASSCTTSSLRGWKGPGAKTALKW